MVLDRGLLFWATLYMPNSKTIVLFPNYRPIGYRTDVN